MKDRTVLEASDVPLLGGRETLETSRSDVVGAVRESGWWASAPSSVSLVS